MVWVPFADVNPKDLATKTGTRSSLVIQGGLGGGAPQPPEATVVNA